MKFHLPALTMRVAVRPKLALAAACISIFSLYCLADTPGLCDEEATTSCNAENRCAASGTTCVVTLKRSGLSATATPDTPTPLANNLFCLKRQKTLQFQTVNSAETFTVNFSNAHKPAPSVVSPLHGSTSSPVSIVPTTKNCYIYSIEVCDPTGCGKQDPKIIIGDN